MSNFNKINMDMQITINLYFTVVNEIQEELNEYDEADFIVTEDQELAMWEAAYRNEEVAEVPYAPVPQNLHVLSNNEEELCKVCRDNERTHALIPCGHYVLCADCVSRLENECCPICNCEFTSTMRIWQ